MDINVLRDSLSGLGTVDYCDWGPYQTWIDINMSNFNGDLDEYNSIIETQVLPTCSTESLFDYNQNEKTILAQYDKI